MHTSTVTVLLPPPRSGARRCRPRLSMSAASNKRRGSDIPSAAGVVGSRSRTHRARRSRSARALWPDAARHPPTIAARSARMRATAHLRVRRWYHLLPPPCHYCAHGTARETRASHGPGDEQAGRAARPQRERRHVHARRRDVVDRHVDVRRLDRHQQRHDPPRRRAPHPRPRHPQPDAAASSATPLTHTSMRCAGNDATSTRRCRRPRSAHPDATMNSDIRRAPA